MSEARQSAAPSKPSEHGFDWKLLRRLWRRTNPYAPQRRVVVATTIIRAFQRPLLFWAVAAVINGPIAAHDYGATWWGTLGFLGLLLSTELVWFIRFSRQNGLGEALVHDLRNDLFANLQRQPLVFYHRTKLGRILSRVVSDLESTRRGLQLMVFLAQEFLQLAICGALMLAASPTLFAVVLGFAPVLVWCNRYFHPRLHRFSRQAAESSSRLTGVLAEAVRGIRVIQGFTRQQRGEAAFNAQAGRLAVDNVQLAGESALYAPLLGVVGQLFLAAMLIVGGLGALHGFGGLTVESLVSYFFLPTSFFLSVQAAAGYYPQILAAQVGAERVFELIDRKPDWEDAPDARELPDPRTAATPGSANARRTPGARIEFRDVTFGYDPARAVLHDLTLRAEPGQTLALVGHTGSGKSTILALLAKLYLPDCGGVFVDGHDTRQLRAASLRRQMGVVLQTNFLFTGTVRDNIRFGRPDATDDEVRAAAVRLDCVDLIESLPRGFDTEVGEGGGNLSLGQRQLVCFARALLADPRLLVLDEATSAIDPVTERRLQRALDRLLAGRTSFVVAHRLSTIVRADQILVLDEGRIVERGTHRELLIAGGAYRDLYREFVSATSTSGPAPSSVPATSSAEA